MSNKTFTRYDNMETLERVLRWPSLLKRFPRVRIYSAEHHAYWRGTGQGYTDSPDASTVMDIEEALKMTRHCGPEKRIRFTEATGSGLSKLELEAQLQAKDKEIEKWKAIVGDVQEARRSRNIGPTGGGNKPMYYPVEAVSEAIAGLGKNSLALNKKGGK